MLLGLVGKPNCGKSTFFKSATLSEVLIANYPFATIKPNHGVGYVKVQCIDKELGVQCHPNHGFCINHWRFVPVELMDVAGLVKGASEGKGLGNQFLDSLREADAFIHIVDAAGTTDADGKSIDADKGYDPCNDIAFLEEELDKWYVGILEKVWKVFAKRLEIDPDANLAKAIAKQFSGLKVDEYQVNMALKKVTSKKIPSLWNHEELFLFASQLRKISKPMIIAANKADHPNAAKNIKNLQDKFPEYMIYPCSADSELALREATKAGLIDYVPGEADFVIKKELNEKQKAALEKIKKDVLDVYNGTGVQGILNLAVFDLMKYITIFPAGATKLADSKGNILPDCFLLPGGSTALDFAYYLHTDLGKNFIKAIDARTKKALGKDYVLKNRDALEIITR